MPFGRKSTRDDGEYYFFREPTCGAVINAFRQEVHEGHAINPMTETNNVRSSMPFGRKSTRDAEIEEVFKDAMYKSSMPFGRKSTRDKKEICLTSAALAGHQCLSAGSPRGTIKLGGGRSKRNPVINAFRQEVHEGHSRQLLGKDSSSKSSMPFGRKSTRDALQQMRPRRVFG